jgi:hypothetical protein
MILDRKRKFNRFNLAVDVEFRANGDSFSGMTKNVSRNGISFISQSCSADVGSPLQFQMRHPKRESTIEACGDIAWKKQMGDKCHLGLRFKDINNFDKSEILDAAYDSWISDIRKPPITKSAQL